MLNRNPKRLARRIGFALVYAGMLIQVVLMAFLIAVFIVFTKMALAYPALFGLSIRLSTVPIILFAMILTWVAEMRAARSIEQKRAALVEALQRFENFRPDEF